MAINPRPRRAVKRDTAATVFSWPQTAILAALLAALGFEAWSWGWHDSLITVVAACEIFYFIFVSFKVVLSVASYIGPASHPRQLPSPDDPGLPVFTILLPNAKEKLHVLRALLESLADMRYPVDKLQILLLVEHWDTQTQKMLGVTEGAADDERIELPACATTILTIPGAPGTKPSACDFGLAHARGQYTLIFDSEDSPDPWMLLKAVRDFRASPPQVACLQARLLFWNILAGKLRSRAQWMAAIVTRMYFVEYAVHFEFVLRGMARLRLVPPLGGTSNIFITDVLREIAIPTGELIRGGIPRDVAGQMVAAWDPWCVAEDADIAGWLARSGYLVEMITDSWTLEEAPMSLAKAARQRARWSKGYAQAGAVQARHPLRAARQMGVRAFIAYTLMTIGTPLSLMLNPLFWGLTIAYFATRSVFIQHLFPPAVFYVGGATFLIGNFILFYLQLAACLRDREPGLVKYMLALGPWWLFTSYSMWKGVIELFIPRLRFHWHLTEHGLENPVTAKREIKRRHDLMSSRNLTSTADGNS
jgi:cellulose synthase/poly-beta-1,6-N-acetylglucosamine synthase-like glycosyltransferase